MARYSKVHEPPGGSTMNEFRVRWEIDVEADSPEEAALEALRIHRDPRSQATEFQVTDQSTQQTTSIDLHDSQYTPLLPNGACVVVTGNPFDGLTVIGPFYSPEDTDRFISENKFDYWWIVPLEEPGSEQA